MQPEPDPRQQKIDKYLATQQAQHRPRSSITPGYRQLLVAPQRAARPWSAMTKGKSSDTVAFLGLTLLILLFILVIWMIAPLILGYILLPLQMT